jgi:cholesterol oxidase
LLQAVDEPRVLRRATPALVAGLIRRLLRRDRDTDVSGEISQLFGDCGLSAGVLPLLGMGRDIPDGRMSLMDSDTLQVDWRKHGESKQYFDRVRQVSEQIANQLGSTFMDNVLWYFNRVITVHALGGCPMGRDAQEGVVDSYGEVFNYPGLHVADGSVMPGPVGPNPSLTIAALADRFADAVLDGRTAPLSHRVRADAAGIPVGPPATRSAEDGPAVSVSFTEEMKGFATFGESDYDHGYRAGKESRTALMFHLTITTGDLERFIADRDHTGSAEGYVRCDALGGKLPVQRGIFNLFVDHEGDRRRKRMLYQLYFADSSGHPLTLSGFKVVEDDPGVDSVWHDTSTLFTRVLSGEVAPGEEAEEIVASGIIHIHPLDFARQLTTFRTDPPGRVDAIARFGALFAGNLWTVYGPHRGGTT